MNDLVRWHHSPDAPPEHFCGDCDRLVRERDAARADADRLALHLRAAIHDLIADWRITGGPRMNYDEANTALRAHEQETT